MTTQTDYGSGARDSGTSDYSAPVSDILLALETVGLKDILELDQFKDIDEESISLALNEFGRLASNIITPTDRIGDLEGVEFDPTSNRVRVPSSFHDAFRQFSYGGWGSLPFPLSYGGGGLPAIVGLAVGEMYASANMALSLSSLLNQGAVEALLHWADEEQKLKYVPPLLAGDWTGTMNLTEPESGSDLGEIRTIAEPYGDRFWRLSGTKCFITWGEHDLAENIIHLVLARTPDAPPGTKGLSLFVVPKWLVRDDGALGERNAVRCVGIEKKLGIHASPTCVMNFDGAVGELVGPLHGGMYAMFTMMNAARLSVGAQGPAQAERAFQQAWSYATNRYQGRAFGVRPPTLSPIIDHPDVRRMLVTMRTSTQVGRLLVLKSGAFGDFSRHAASPEFRDRSRHYIDLLTPVAKAWSTDAGFQAASLGVQVFGGAGFIEESGIAQRLRDSRIAPIYEGTNGIQAIDLVFRKLPRDRGRWVNDFLNQMGASTLGSSPCDQELSTALTIFGDLLSSLRDTTELNLARLDKSPRDVAAGASAYLELFGTTVGGGLMIERARCAVANGSSNAERTIDECNFFAAESLSRAFGLVRPIMSGAKHLDQLFESF